MRIRRRQPTVGNVCWFVLGVAALVAVQSHTNLFATWTRASVARGVASTSRAAAVTTEAPQLSEEALAERAREFVMNDGFYKPVKEELMADEFVFCGPIIGPQNKQDFLGTLGIFKVYDAFPDLKMSVSKFVQDPENANRYWGVTRVQGTHTGEFNMASTMVAPTGKRMVVGPQCVSVTFNDEGLVSYYTGGYVVDYRDGETGSAGAFAAICKSIGAFFPTGRLNQFLSWLATKRKQFPKPRSHKLDLPPAWADYGRDYGLRSAETWS